MPRGLQRREFLLMAVTAAVSVVVDRVLLRSLPRLAPAAEPTADPQVEALTNLLKQTLDYLQLDPADLAAFARDFQTQADRQLKALQADDPEQFAKEISVQFLLSTDFFWNGAEESRPVKYRAYYDPYRACSSPFARFD